MYIFILASGMPLLMPHMVAILALVREVAHDHR